MDKEKEAKLFYDGDCPMCTAFAGYVKDQNHAPTLSDANALPNPPAPLNDMLDEIHLYEEDGRLRKGADAILTTLARTHSWLTPITTLFRLPGLSHIARLIYRFIAKRRKLWFGSGTSRLYWVYLITNIGLLSGVILSWPLWGYDRTYPLIPIIKSATPLTQLSSWFSIALVFSLLFSLFTVTKQRQTALISLILIFLLVITDLTRLQPWVWHYAILLLLFSIWQPANREITDKIILAASFVVVGIYFWSGIQKINSAFYLEVFPWFTETLWQPLGTFGQYLFLSLGIFIPFIESAFAIGFLTRRYRKTALLTAGAMLTLVLSALMIGHNWNSSVWPWNLAIFGMALALFLNRKESFIEILKKVKNNTLAYMTIGLFVVMPLGNFFGLTHHYLSWSLYSGHVPTAYLTADASLIQKLSPSDGLAPQNTGLVTLPFVNFAIDTLNVVPYPETWLFESIFLNLCSTHQPYPMSLTIVTRPPFNSLNASYTKLECP